MTKANIKQVQDALACVMGKVAGQEVSPGSPAVVFALPFVDRNNQAFRLYAYTRGKKIFLTDAGQVLGTLKKSGLQVQLDLLQALMRSFGLVIIDDGSVIEQTNRPLWQRVASVLQALMTADGVLRTWAARE